MADGRDSQHKLQEIAEATGDLRPTDDFTRATLERVLAAEAPEGLLVSLGEATRELAPADPFTDAVMARIGALAPSSSTSGADPFAALAAATAHLRPADTFTDAVMAEVAPQAGLSDGILRAARPTLFVAAFAAAACLLVSWVAERDYDDVSMAASIEESSQ